jgi:hypothetical protein
LQPQVAFVPFAGTSDDLTRSHFETQDTIELGQSAGGSRDFAASRKFRTSASSFAMGVAAEAVDRGRTPEQIALHLVAHLVLQELQFGAGLDAFSEHRQAKAAAKT